MIKALDRSARRELISEAAARLRRRGGMPLHRNHSPSQACPVCGAAVAAPAGSARLHDRGPSAPARRALRPESAASGPARS